MPRRSQGPPGRAASRSPRERSTCWGPWRDSRRSPTRAYPQRSAAPPGRTVDAAADRPGDHALGSRLMVRQLDDATDMLLTSLLVADGRATLKSLAEASGLSLSAV